MPSEAWCLSRLCGKRCSSRTPSQTVIAILALLIQVISRRRITDDAKTICRNKDGKVDIVVAGKNGLSVFENRGTPPAGRLDGKPKS